MPDRAKGTRLPSIPGVVPGQGDRPTGCQFNPRCPFALPRCAEYDPEFRRFGGTVVACHRAEELNLGPDTGDAS